MASRFTASLTRSLVARASAVRDALAGSAGAVKRRDSGLLISAVRSPLIALALIGSALRRGSQAVPLVNLSTEWRCFRVIG